MLPQTCLLHVSRPVRHLAMMLTYVASLGIFAVKHDQIAGHFSDDGNCLLYTKKEQLRDGHLSKGVSCRFAIWGSGFVAFACGFLILSYLLKIVGGAAL